MRKTMALMLALVLAISMCACNTAQPEENPFIPGTVVNNRYESTFAGVACQLDGDWTFQTEQEIRETNEKTMELTGMDYADALRDASVVMDMLATHPNQLDSVNVTFVKISGIDAVLVDDAYASIYARNAVAALEEAGAEDITYEIGKIQFAGSQHSAIRLSGTYLGIDMYETVVVVNCGSYMMLVTTSTWYENTTEEILANFVAI